MNNNVDFIKLEDLQRVINAVIAKYGKDTQVMVYSSYDNEGAMSHPIVGLTMGSTFPPRLDIEVSSGDVSKVFSPGACLTGICRDCKCDIEFGEELCNSCWIEARGGYPDYEHCTDDV